MISEERRIQNSRGHSHENATWWRKLFARAIWSATYAASCSKQQGSDMLSPFGAQKLCANDC